MIDVAIIGGGPVGAAVAAFAARCGLDVAIFEARTAPSGDARTLALSHASRELLEDAHAWPRRDVTPIQSIHISQKGGPGRTLLEASEQSLPALGYTVGFSTLEGALGEALAAEGRAPNYGETCDHIALDSGAAVIRFASGREVRARLLVLADGGANATKIPGIAFTEKDYAQQAVVASVRTDKPHGFRAYERFTPDGPVALLPVAERFALVWTATPDAAQRLLALDDSAFLAQLQSHFGDRAGRFLSVASRAAFALKLRTVNVPVALRTAIIGNAAQALHPIAGQGLNLGLRDAATLAGLLHSTPREAVGSAAMLSAYQEARQRDASRGVMVTDFLVSAFADSRRLPTWGRGLALAALDLFPPARRLLAERMIHGAPS